MSFKFSETKAATANLYLNPGVYKAKVTKVEAGKFPKGSPYLGIEFETEDELTFTEKFGFGSEAGTEVSLKRLQYLHEGFFNKTCNKDFSSLEELETYFKKALTTKAIVKTIIVGGNESGGNVYACLPFAGFIVEDDSEYEVGEFTEGDKNWKKFVKKSNSEVADKKNGILADDDNTEIGGKGKKVDKTPTKANKGAEVAKDDNDDMPW